MTIKDCITACNENIKADNMARAKKYFDIAWKEYVYNGRVTYLVTITRELADGTKIDELREQFPGQERAKAFSRFAALQKQYPGIASVKDVARRSWERK